MELKFLDDKIQTNKTVNFNAQIINLVNFSDLVIFVCGSSLWQHCSNDGISAELCMSVLDSCAKDI